LLIRYEGPSWTEIRDQRGQLLISRLVDADSIEPFDGTPPFSIVLGNARAVTLIYRGQPVDLAPYTRLNVARLVLR
jgi:cytoskeleton protein RodZ